MISLLSRVSRHGVLFAVAKSAVFAAPLLAASQLTSTEYGTVEWWLSLSAALGPMVGFGAHALIAYGTLGSPARRHTRTAVIFVIQASAALVLLALVLPILGWGWAESFVGPVAMQCAVVSLQLALSARLKGLGKGAWASLVESSLYVTLLGALLVVLLGIDFVNGFMGLMLLVCCALVTGLLRVAPTPVLSRWPKRNYRAYFRSGLRFVLGGVLVGLFMAAPRAALGFLADPDAVARFALAFRWLSVAIVAHQFLNTVFFRQLYGAEKSIIKRDRSLAITIAIVAILSTAVAIFITTDLIREFGLPLPMQTDGRLIWILAASMVLWSTTACLEGCLYRIDATYSQAAAGVTGLVAFGVAVLSITLLEGVSVTGMAWAWLFGFSAMIFVQMFCLRQSGIKLPHLQWTLASAVVLIAIGWLN